MVQKQGSKQNRKQNRKQNSNWSTLSKVWHCYTRHQLHDYHTARKCGHFSDRALRVKLSRHDEILDRK
jgi:hypothetical protein